MSLTDIRYAWVFFWSAAGLLFERFWHAFWPALSVVALFIGFACLNLFTAFGAVAHFILLFLFVAGFSLAATRLGAGFRFPRAREVRRAIEIESELRHRPLEAMLDKPVEGTHESSHRLWASYQERLERLRERLKTYRPKPNAAARDPYSLRIAAAVVMLLGLAVAQQEAGYRIRQGMFVDVTQWVHASPVALDAWIVPPDYTRQNPVFLATTQLGVAPTKGAITVPENSLLKVRLSGYDDPPHVTYGGTDSPAFTQAAAHSFTMEMPLTKDGELRIKKGWLRRLGHWQIAVTPDAAPEITLLGTEKSDRATMKIKFKVSDDYGIKKIYGMIAATDELKKTAFGDRTIDFDIPVPDDLHKDEQVYTADLAWHPWAGSPVMLTLSAEDDAGHTVSTPAQKITLPERDFKNPTAQQIIAQRKRLIWYDNLITERLVARALAEVASRPQNYKYDEITFLGLDVATKRLVYDGGPESVQSDIALLWDLAVRVEDGGLSLAARELSDALQRLSDGLKDKNMTKDQIQDLLDQVRQKMRDYMKTMAQEMQQRMEEGKSAPHLSQDLTDKLMKHIDMDKLMQQMRDLASGSERDQMQKMAQFMKNSIDNFDPAKLDQMQAAQRKAMDALNNLDKLIQRQQSLLDHTNKMQPKPGQQQQQQQQSQDQQNQQQQQQSGQDDQQQQGGQGQQDQQQSGSSGSQQQQDGQQGQQDQQQMGQDGQPQSGGESAQPQQGGQQQQGGQPSQPQAGQQGSSGQQPGQQQGPGSGQQPGMQMGQGQGQSQGQGQTPSSSGPQVPGPGGQQQQPGGGGAQQQATGGGGPGQPQPQGAGGEKFPDVKNTKQGATEQGAIRDKLGDILRDLGTGMQNLPQQFSNADQSMKGAQSAFKQGDPQSSAAAQRQALENLQKGEDDALAAMAKSLQAMLSMGFMPPGQGGGYGQGFDPLGRDMGDGQGGQPGDIKLPDEKERRRVQQIIEELRNRSNDYQRPKVERDYIDRLLQTFD